MNIIHQIFDYLTDIPVNFWFWFFIVTAPILIFSFKPTKNSWILFARIVAAVFITYVLINLSLGTSNAIAWKEYEQCKSQFSDGAINDHGICKLHGSSGASSIFYLYFGWIACIAYTGIWELIWRKHYSKEIKKIVGFNKYIKVSNQLINTSKLVWMYCLVTIIIIVGSLLLDKLIIPLVNTIAPI